MRPEKRGGMGAEAIQPARFGLLRHVETVWNREKRIQGRKDSPLTANGVAKARTLGIWLGAFPWDRIVTSRLARSVRTGALINETLKLPLESMPELDEMDWGSWEGLSLTQIRAVHPQRLALLETDFWSNAPPGGETRARVFDRTHAALNALARKHPAEQVLVIVHGGVLKALFQGASTAVRQRDVSGYLHWFVSDGTTLTLGDAVRLGGPV